MIGGNLGAISRKATYTETIEVRSDEDNELLDLEGADVTVSISDPDDVECARITGTTDDGKVVVTSPGYITFRFDDMTPLYSRTYRLRCIASRDDDTALILDAHLSVTD